MDIRILNKRTEIETVNKWLPFPLKASDLPGHTFCAAVNNEIVAFAGLRLMEGELCCIDSVASNQTFESSVRHEALEKLAKTLLDLARNLGFKRVIAFTEEPCILKRADNLGFRVSNQTILAKEL